VAAERDSLVTILGGRRSAWDASLPGLGFVAGWLAAHRFGAADHDVELASATALVVGVVVAAVRVRQSAPPRAVVLGMLGVCVAAIVALRTGRAADFFLIQVLANAASALAWALSVLLRWPLLGVVVGFALGQRTRWRRDPDLLRAYGRASWLWVGQYAMRLAVFAPLWLAGQVVALGVARAVLSWPLVTACIAASWWVLRSSLPPDHPGLRHPVTGPAPRPEPAKEP
jgi:xanthosine utilization system XapX-like protein